MIKIKIPDDNTNQKEISNIKQEPNTKYKPKNKPYNRIYCTVHEVLNPDQNPEYGSVSVC